MTQDQAVLVSIPGIGKKLAERIIFELKEKVAAAGVAASGSVGGLGAAESEVVAALQALGYSLGEAREASQAALADATIGGTLEDRVKAALADAPPRLTVAPASLTGRRPQIAEERDDVPREQLRLLGRREMAAARHRRPAPDVVQPLGPLARWRALRDELVVEQGDGGRDRDAIGRPERPRRRSGCRCSRGSTTRSSGSPT